MPLVYQQNINESTKLGVWHIEEPESFFLKKVILQNSITHPHKRLQHLAARYMLSELFEDFPLELILIANTKKPFLMDEAFHFSVSHSGDYAAVIVSKNYRVGVDIEVLSEKINRIRHKFLSESEENILQKMDEELTDTQVLTLAWGIKETLYKWYGDGGLDFIQHLHIHSITCESDEYIAGCSINKIFPIKLKVKGLLFNNSILTWTIS